jgi:hypothetical protein
MSLKKTGEYSVIHDKVKHMFTIHRKHENKTEIIRKLECKTPGCRMKGMIKEVGKSKSNTELWFNSFEHLPTCIVIINPMTTPEFKVLLKSDMKPTKIIEKFNKEMQDTGQIKTNSLKNELMIPYLDLELTTRLFVDVDSPKHNLRVETIHKILWRRDQRQLFSLYYCARHRSIET